MSVLPANLHILTDALSRGGWTFQVVHRTSSPDADDIEHPYVTVEAARAGRHLDVSWHTRGTGTYRLFSVLIDRRRSSTFTAALGLAKSPWEPA